MDEKEREKLLKEIEKYTKRLRKNLIMLLIGIVEELLITN